jgi:glycine/D-amino acid oxidase-like deaminating enzyme
MLSYWEQQSFINYDHIIIGSGIVGLSLAIELKELQPKSRILVLERGLLPTGASSKNAGFACMGSVTELLDDLKTMSEDEVVALFEKRKKGLELLRKRVGDDSIDYAENGSFELISKKELTALDQIEYLNKLIEPIIKQPAFKLAGEKIERFGFSKEYTKGLIENTCEGELNSGKMLKRLIEIAMQPGVEIKTGADVEHFEEENNYISVSIKDPFRKENLVLRANTLSICTNAFTKKLLPGTDVTPGRGQVLITEPIKDLKFKGIFHFDSGYYYFREIHGRVLFGGGRNLDFKTEATTEFAITELVQNDLERKLREIILPGNQFKIAQRWSGIMAFGATKQPIVKQISQRVFGAFRMGGMGVALGSTVAKSLSEIVISSY